MATLPVKVDHQAVLPNSVIQFTSEEALLTQYVSETQYWEKYYENSNGGFEWNNGRLEQVPMSSPAEYQTFVWFNDLFKDYLFGNPIGQVIGLEMGFRLALPEKVTIRKPDLGLVLNTNPVPLGYHDRRYAGVFDIAVESISASSESEIYRDAVTKRAEYAQVGVQEYYILDERGLETRFLSLGPGGIYFEIPSTDGIIRSSVLPGFQFREQDLYQRPRPSRMLNDPVYRAFISPELRAERVRTEQAEELAKQEKARADQLGLRAEQAEGRAEQAEALAEQERALTEQEKARAEQEKARAEQEKARAEQERARAEQADARAIAAERLAIEYAARLRSLGGLPPESP
jgi:hypothetical protein